MRIQNGDVNVNGQVEIRRGRKLYGGDVVAFEEASYGVEFTTTKSGDDWI